MEEQIRISDSDQSYKAIQTGKCHQAWWRGFCLFREGLAQELTFALVW